MDESTAFNRGCDARQRGEPLSACPFDVQRLRAAWNMGWRDAHHYWGADRQMGTYQPLPPVKRPA